MKMDDSRKLECPNQKDLVIESFLSKICEVRINIPYFKCRISSDKRRASNKRCFLISATLFTVKSE